ncbi:MAG: T9SS type A sorting domain-containing protein, partial [Bacteroidota bacterium]
FEFDPVCVTDEFGDIITLPNTCFAECLGYAAEDYVECEIIIDNPDCECEFDFEPVCVVDEFGDIIPFPNACLAECFGYTADDFVDCGDLGGGEDPECDCDFVFDPVCVVDEFGEVILLPNACLAECIGFSPEDFVDCDGDGNGGLSDDDAPHQHSLNTDRVADDLDNEDDDDLNGNLPTGNTPVFEGITASPNPTTDLVQVSWKSTHEGTYAWQLLDLNGRLIQQQMAYTTGQQEILQVDLSNLAKGVYLIRLQTQTGGETLKVTKF